MHFAPHKYLSKIVICSFTLCIYQIYSSFTEETVCIYADLVIFFQPAVYQLISVVEWMELRVEMAFRHFLLLFKVDQMFGVLCVNEQEADCHMSKFIYRVSNFLSFNSFFPSWTLGKLLIWFRLHRKKTCLP